MSQDIDVLFTMEPSIYDTLTPGRTWGISRNAITWPGGNPIIAHPPCRAWSRMRGLSKAPKEEKYLAIWAIEQVRTWGGVLEHPAHSTLWGEMDLPLGNDIDKWNGFSIYVEQSWYGHLCKKPTWLYIAGIHRNKLPALTPNFMAITHTISTPPKNQHGNRPKNGKKELPKSLRSATPIGFARLLIEIAEQCTAPKPNQTPRK